MAVDVASFKAAFAEFTAAPDALVTSYLALADGQLGALWGSAGETTAAADLTLRDQGHLYLTAHLLALSPQGRPMALAADDDETLYWPTFKRLRKRATAGVRCFLPSSMG